MNRYGRPIAALLAVLMLAGQLFFSLDRMVAEATVATTQEQIDKVSEEKDQLEEKLDEQQSNISGLKGEQKTLQGELKNLNRQLTEVSEKLEELGKQIQEKEQEIAVTQDALEEAAALEEWQHDCMVARVQNMYESSDNDYINTLILSGSFSELLNAADWMEEILQYDQRKLAEMQKTRQVVEETKSRLQAERAELNRLKETAEAEKNKVSELVSQTASSIHQYAGQIEEAEQKALDYEAELKKKEEDLEYLRKKLEEEIALSRAAANATWRDISEVEFAEGDRKLLANLIYCEAGAEPDEGKLAVGSVVMNRVLSSKYPDTVVGVIYQSHQFTPVGSGRLELALTYDKATEACYKAADDAMAGVTNVGNCVYFRTPIEGLTGIRIGGHIFY